LHLAAQIAAALEAAHSRGIIHRDLKPANIKLTPEGNVKVLDFGLAKALEEQQAAISNSPTAISASTDGMIVGTAAYMSPEQANGKDVDRMTDVWAFGCVLFEMLTGAPVFTGDTASEILAAVLKTEPDWHRFPAATPQVIRSLIQRCLRKDRKLRHRDIGDARLEIAEPAMMVERGKVSQEAGSQSHGYQLWRSSC
jgi:serine/threonine protein kinase